MGNCQAAEAATVVIQHPGANAKVERIYWSIAAKEVMSSNPGNYVALVSESRGPSNGPPVKQLKLLRPDDTLHMGNVYRLIAFEDVIKELAAKKSVKLGKLLKENGVIGVDKKKKMKLEAGGGSQQNDAQSLKIEEVVDRLRGGISSNSSGSRGAGRQHGGGGQWKPALHSISEVGS